VSTSREASGKAWQPTRVATPGEMILVLRQLRSGDALSFTRCAAVLRISAIVQLNTELFSGPVVERSGHGQIMVPFSSRGLRIARQSAHGNHKPYLCAIKIQKAIPMRQFSLVLLGCNPVFGTPFFERLSLHCASVIEFREYALSLRT